MCLQRFSAETDRKEERERSCQTIMTEIRGTRNHKKLHKNNIIRKAYINYCISPPEVNSLSQIWLLCLQVASTDLKSCQ